MTLSAKASVVLLLAADEMTRRSTKSCLERSGYDVVVAPSPAEARSLLTDEGAPRRVAVLITDVDVAGDTDGLGLAQLARQSDPDMPIIYTARQPHRVPETRRVRGAPILRTPYMPQQMVGLIGELRGRAGA
jgi:DNA-binding NtrC family response regulator